MLYLVEERVEQQEPIPAKTAIVVVPWKLEEALCLFSLCLSPLTVHSTKKHPRLVQEIWGGQWVGATWQLVSDIRYVAPNIFAGSLY